MLKASRTNSLNMWILNNFPIWSQNQYKGSRFVHSHVLPISSWPLKKLSKLFSGKKNWQVLKLLWLCSSTKNLKSPRKIKASQKLMFRIFRTIFFYIRKRTIYDKYIQVKCFLNLVYWAIYGKYSLFMLKVSNN